MSNVAEVLYKFFADDTLDTFEGIPTQEIREWLQEQIPAKREIPQGMFAEMDDIVKGFCNDIVNAIMRISDGNNK